MRIKPTRAKEHKWVYYQDRHDKYNTYTEWHCSTFYIISFHTFKETYNIQNSDEDLLQ